MHNMAKTKQDMVSSRDTPSTDTDSVLSPRGLAPSLHLDGNPNQSSAKAGVSLMLVCMTWQVSAINMMIAETWMSKHILK